MVRAYIYPMKGHLMTGFTTYGVTTCPKEQHVFNDLFFLGMFSQPRLQGTSPHGNGVA